MDHFTRSDSERNCSNKEVSSFCNCARGCVGQAGVTLVFSSWLFHPSVFSQFHPLLFYSIHIKSPQTTAEALIGWKGL